MKTQRLKTTRIGLKKRVSALAVICGLATGLPLLSMAQDSQTLVIGRSMDVNSLDPARAFCDTCQIYLTAVYETLVTLGEDNKTLVPNLATRWDVNDNFTEFTFYLNPEAVFADGSPVEAADVVWTFERLKNLKGSPSFLMDGTTGITATDAHTVTITVEAPNSEFNNKVSAPYTGIVNAEVVMAGGAVADESAATTDNAEGWFLANSAGSGPFVLTRYSPEDELRLARNDNYYGAAPGFAEVVVTQMQDAVSQAQALEIGAIDIAMQIDADTAKSLRSDDVVTEIVPSFNFVYFAFMPGAANRQNVENWLDPVVKAFCV